MADVDWREERQKFACHFLPDRLGRTAFFMVKEDTE
jgi:hypothetical protein